MDERKQSEQLRKLAQLYALGELNQQGYREQRNAILDYCEGVKIEIPQAEETPVNVFEPGVERLSGEATAMRAASSIIDARPPPAKRSWGLVIIALALCASGYAIYSAYN